MAEEVDTQAIADELRRHAAQCQDLHEENIRQRAEDVLRNKALRPMGVDWGLYEFTGRYAVVRGPRRRSDTLYGRVIIEYERPGALAVASRRGHAYSQAMGYIREQAGSEASWHHYLGVVLDGYQIGFVKYRGGKWDQQGPYDVNGRNILTLLTAIRGLQTKALKVDFLKQDLGPRSEAAKLAVRSFYGSLVARRNARVEMLLDDWRRTFQQACGYSPEKAAGLEKEYEIESGAQTDYSLLLFSIHTYFALIMKLIASEVATYYTGPLMRSYIRRLEDASQKGAGELREALEELESGGVFASTMGIKNFLEADYFSWYLSAWSDDLVKAVTQILKTFSEYDPSTLDHDPDSVKDLLKDLYHFLIPRDIRYRLGEYYTPDWLAEFVLSEVGFTGNPEHRTLDPACGSGTFLVLIVRRIRQYADSRSLDRKTVLRQILANVVGFDLNPLAVIASRTNYLLALGDLVRDRGSDNIEIPVYLADSVFTERRMTLEGGSYAINTAVGEFQVPSSLVDTQQLQPTLLLVEECLRDGYPVSEFAERYSEAVLGEEEGLDIVKSLYETFLGLEKHGKNRIWTKVIKNSFAPLVSGLFDFVVGNPPWIGWEHLPELYRRGSLKTWEQYGLVMKAASPGMGNVRKELAMLFVAVGIQRYLRAGGRLAFLVPFTVFKATAGAGFRNFLTSHARIDTVHDMVELAPFEDATNRTSMLVATKDGRTTFPVACVTWTKSMGGSLHFGSTLPEVEDATNRREMLLTPVQGESAPESPWLILPEAALKGVEKTLGKSPYTAHAGVFTGLNGAFYVRVTGKRGDRLIIENIADVGKRRDVPTVEPRAVRSEFVFPLAFGEDVHQWVTEPSSSIVIPVGNDGAVLSPSQLRRAPPRGDPQLYDYFRQLFDVLVTRNAEPYKTKLKPYRTEKLATAERLAPPFYWLFNVSSALREYKVAYKRTAGKISGKAQFTAALIAPEAHSGKPIIPNEQSMFVPVDSEEEASYLVSVLNSSPIRLAVASFAMERHIPNVMEYVRVPNFDPRDDLHSRLSQLGAKAVGLAAAGKTSELKEVASEIDQVSIGLWGITPPELDAIAEALRAFG